jgi:hypothetical protein
VRVEKWRFFIEIFSEWWVVFAFLPLFSEFWSDQLLMGCALTKFDLRGEVWWFCGVGLFATTDLLLWLGFGSWQIWVFEGLKLEGEKDLDPKKERKKKKKRSISF